MKYLIITFLSAFLFESSIYTLQFFSVKGEPRTFSAWQGKKILLVNIATAGPRAGQLTELKQLKQQQGDSLEIILFPSNSFGNESRSDSAIRIYCDSLGLQELTIAQKGDVKGSNIQTVYRWLTSATENGDMDFPIGGDFQKYLINKEGRISGVFAPSVSPLSSQFLNAIQ